MLRIQLIGNLGSDAEVKNFNGKNALCFNVAHTDKWTDEKGQKHEDTTWVSCILNGDGGKVKDYLKKGTAVYVEGAGSTRVYSSPKLKQFVAGVNIRVDHIELVGGSSDEVPKNLATSDGALWPVFKAYFVAKDAVTACGASESQRGVLLDAKFNQYQVDQYGFITKPQTTQDTPQDTGADGAGQDQGENQNQIF